MNNSEIILYTTPQGDVKLEVIVQDETVWLTQKTMGELFGVAKSTINEHLTNIYQSGELDKEATVRKIRTVQNEADREVARNLDFYNLDAIIWVAKNYLNKKEIDELNRIVTMYLDYAENQAARQIPMKMKDWVGKLDAFLQFNDYSVLKNAGSISAEIAKKLATKQFEIYRIKQDSEYESDFDKEIKRIKGVESET